jgi:hypothetical protein
VGKLRGRSRIYFPGVSRGDRRSRTRGRASATCARRLAAVASNDLVVGSASWSLLTRVLEGTITGPTDSIEAIGAGARLIPKKAKAR